MRVLKAVALVMFLIFLAPLVSGQSTVDKISDLMDAYAKNGQFNGVCLIKKADSVIYQKAFGYANREWDVMNSIDSKFLIGSIGKPITALMTLILVNDGLINLNASINDYIPEYSGPAKNKATIHQLLTHSSGIPDHGAVPNYSKKRVRWIYNSDEYLQLITETAAKFEPGAGFGYSGIGYNILAIICERVCKKDFGELLKERVFLPLGMVDSKLDRNLDIDTKRADGYEYHLLEGYTHPSYIEMCHVKGSGGVLTTADDLARFSNECFKSQKLISKELYTKMFTPYIKDWQYYGYGWWITNKSVNSDSLTLISHGGSTDGYKAYLTRIVQDSIDIILFQNNYFRTELGVQFDYFTTSDIIDILHGKTCPLPKKSIAKDMGYAIGRYGIDEAVKQYFKLKGNHDYYIDEDDFNQLGKELYENYNLKQAAFSIYELAVSEYPNSFILNFSYGVRLADENNELSAGYLKKCVELYQNDPENKKYTKEFEKAQKSLSGAEKKN